MTAAKPSPRTRLKDETRLVHERVDAAFSQLRLNDPDDYATFLTAHWRAMQALEAGIRHIGLPVEMADLPDCDLTALIADDLANLGRALPPSSQTPPVSQPLAAAGLLYVKAGSRMGAQILHREVLHSSNAMPVAYLSDRTGIALWRGFISVLETMPLKPDDYSLMKEGALAGFDLFEASLAETRLSQ